ncbi:MAG: hypothetical protein WC718_06280 [Phycisphaerales bacterium]|jgi:hypothetical protein
MPTINPPASPHATAKKKPPHPTAGGQKINVATAGNHRPGDFQKAAKPGAAPGQTKVGVHRIPADGVIARDLHL